MLDTIKKAKKIAILMHQSPDGDAIGSSMAIYYALKNLKKDVIVIAEYVSPMFNFLPKIDKIKNNSNKNYDLVICVDSTNKERLYNPNNLFENAKETINIDHHLGNSNYATYNHVEENSPACAQSIYLLFKKWQIPIDENIMQAILTGILTDTNGFLYPKVDNRTFQIASEIRKKIPTYEIYNKLIYTKTLAQYKLEKLVIKRLKFYEQGKIAFVYLTKKDLHKCGAMKGDHEGLVNVGRNVDGVEVSFLIREIDGGYNVSLRSNSIDVHKIAMLFGGGGHILAAGIKTDLPFFKLKKQLFEEITKELKKK